MSHDKDIQKGIALGGLMGGAMGGVIGGVRENYGARKTYSKYNKIAEELSNTVKTFYDSVLTVDENGVSKLDFEKILNNHDKTENGLKRAMRLHQRISQLNEAKIQNDPVVHEILLEELINQVAPYIQNEELFNLGFENVSKYMDKINEYFDKNSPLSSTEVQDIMKKSLRSLKEDFETFKYVPDILTLDEAAIKELHTKETQELDTKAKRKEFMERYQQAFIVLRSKFTYFTEMADMYDAKAESATDPSIKAAIKAKSKTFRDQAASINEVIEEINNDKGHATEYVEFLTMGKGLSGEAAGKIVVAKMTKNLNKNQKDFVNKHASSQLIEGDPFVFSDEFQLEGNVPQDFEGTGWLISRKQESSNATRLVRTKDGKVQSIYRNDDGSITLERGNKGEKVSGLSLSKIKDRTEVFEEMKDTSRTNVIKTMKDTLTESMGKLNEQIEEVRKEQAEKGTSEERAKKLREFEDILNATKEGLNEISELEGTPINLETYKEIIEQIQEDIDATRAAHDTLLESIKARQEDINARHAAIKSATKEEVEALETEIKQFNEDNNQLDELYNKYIGLIGRLNQRFNVYNSYLTSMYEKYGVYAQLMEDDTMYEFQPHSMAMHSLEHIDSIGLDNILKKFYKEAVDDSADRRLPMLEDWQSFLRTAASEKDKDATPQKNATNAFLHKMDPDSLSDYRYVAVSANSLSKMEDMFSEEQLNTIEFFHDGKLQTYKALKDAGVLDKVTDLKVLIVEKELDGSKNKLVGFKDQLMYYSLPESTR
jgi:hypothetical protein